MELVAQQGSDSEISPDKGWLKGLIYRSRKSSSKVDEWVNALAKIGLIDKNSLAIGVLKIPKLNEYGDEYSSRKKDISTSSRQTPDNVVLDKKRIDKKRREESKPNQSISFLEKIPSQDLQELSEKYKIAPKGIQSKAFDLKLYCESKGKSYKNYRAFLENALRKDLVSLRERFPLPKHLKDSDGEKPLTPEERERQKKFFATRNHLVTAKSI